MTDAEFEALDAEARRFLRRGRPIPWSIARTLATCRDCDTYPTEHYMLPRKLWLSVVPGGRGRLCLACLAKRLGRPLVEADFSEQPESIEDVLRRTGELC
jgi:hypothetical protein